MNGRPPILISTQCFPPETGGIEGLMGDLAASIARLGYPVEVFADASRDGRQAASDGMVVLRFGGPKPLRRRWKAWRVGRRLARERCALITDSWKSLEFLAGGQRPALGSLCLAHGMEFPGAPSPNKAARIARALSWADAVAANSSFTASEARALAPDARVHVAPPAVRSPPAVDESVRTALASRLGAGAPLVVTVARLEPRKGVDATLRAIASVADRYPNIVYAVAGAGPDLARLTSLAEALGMTGRVHFLGRVSESEKWALLEAADLFAMPTRREGASVEGFGVAYVEAALMGVPSIAGRAGGEGDAVIDGETGLLCDGADDRAVVATMVRLLDDGALAARLGAAARRRAEGRLWPDAARSWLSLLSV